MDSRLTDLASAWVEGSDSSQPGATVCETTIGYGHSGPEVNACDYPQCGKSFSRPYDVTRHRRIHFSDDNHICHVLGCKYKKKKTWSRTDKFREHLNTHRDKAQVECPLHDCGSILLFGDELEAHVAQEHHFFERHRDERSIRNLLIDITKGRLECPVNCGYKLNYVELFSYHVGGRSLFYAPIAFRDHIYTHELEDRVQFAASLETCGVNLRQGVATCPICMSKVCTSADPIGKLFLHLEQNHGDNLQEHAQKLAELIGCTKLTSVYPHEFPLLKGVIQGVLETQKALSLFKEGGAEPSPLTDESYGDIISSGESSTLVLQPAFNSAVMPGQHYNQQHSDSLLYITPVEDVSESTAIMSQGCSAYVPASPSGSLHNDQSQPCIGHGLSIGEHSSMLQPQPQYAGFDVIPVTADLAACTTSMQAVFSNLGGSSITHGIGNIYMHLGSPMDMADHRYFDTCAALHGNSYDQGLNNNIREQHLIAACGSREQNNYGFATSTDALPSFSNVASGQPYTMAYRQSKPAQHGFQTGPTSDQPLPSFAQGWPGLVISPQYQPMQYDFQTMSNAMMPSAMMPSAMMPDPAMVPNTMMPNIPLTIVSDASGQQYAVPSNQLYPTTSGISMMPSTTQPFFDNVPAFTDNLQVMDDGLGISDD